MQHRAVGHDEVVQGRIVFEAQAARARDVEISAHGFAALRGLREAGAAGGQVIEPFLGLNDARVFREGGNGEEREQEECRKDQLFHV